MSDDFSQFQLGRKANSTNGFTIPASQDQNAFNQVGNNTLVQNNPVQSPNYIPGQYGFTLNPDGSAEFQDIVATGDITASTITASSGTIGGFTIGATTLTGTNLVLDSNDQRISLGSGNDIVILDANDATYRLWAGHATAGSAPFYVTKAGAVVASDITITSGNSLIEETSVVYAPLKRSLVAGEAITAQDAVAISDGTLVGDELVDVAGNSNAITVFDGSDGTSKGEKVAQSFTLSSATSVKQIYWNAKRISGTAASYTINCTIQADSSGEPSGTPLGSTATANSGDWGTGGFNDSGFVFGTAPSLSASTTYWIVIERASGSSATDYFEANSNNGGNPYANGLAKIRKYGGTWDNAHGNTTSDLGFTIFELVDGGEIAQASALSNDARTKNFIGFAESTVAKGASVDVYIQGAVTIAGLSAGGLYYLSDTRGDISTTPGTTTRKVGIAVASDEILITNLW